MVAAIPRCVLPVLALVALHSPLAARSDVLVVDAAGGPGSHHTQIQAAVEAAASGDLLLVRSGTYAPFAIHGKALTVVADLDADVRVAGEMVVRFTPAGQAVHLRGLASELGAQRGLRGLVLGANVGAVLVEDCALAGSAAAVEWIPNWGYEFHAAQPALRAAGDAPVVLLGCSLSGGRGKDSLDEDLDPFALPGAPAAWVSGGSLHVHGSTFAGGQGGGQFDTVTWNGEAGGAGLSLEAGFLYASTSSFRGGQGGRADHDPFSGQCGDGGDGGHGLELLGGASAVHAACTFEGGAGGAPGGAACSPGAPGLAIAPPGAASELAEPARSLVARTPVRAGQAMLILVEGPPGEPVWLMVGPLSPAWQPVLGGSRLVLPERLVSLGTIPPSGLLQASLPIPALPPAHAGLAQVLQAVHHTPAGRRLGGGSLWVWLQAQL